MATYLPPIIERPIFFPPGLDLPPMGVFALPFPGGMPFFFIVAIMFVVFEGRPIFPDEFFGAFIVTDSRSDATKK